jgi:hypothetical protein
MNSEDLSLVNAALTRTGDDPISSFTDADRIAATIADLNYEFIVKSELARSRMKLPTKTQQLSLIDADEMGDPPAPWLYAYTLPTDLVVLHTIKVFGMPVKYEQAGKIIFCDQDETVEVVAHYSWRIPADWFSPEFAEGIIRRMEAVFCRGVGERHKEAAARDAAADEIFAQARTRDAQSQTPRDPVLTPTLSARGGSPSSTLRARRG